MSAAPGKPARQLVFGALALLLVLAAIELTSLIVYRWALGSWFEYGPDASRRAALRTRAPAADAADRPPEDRRIRVPTSAAEERLHPFIGFVHDYPGAPAGYLRTTAWGFYQRSAEPPAPADAYRIGVVGGSAAFLFSFKGSERLADGLRRAPFVAGRQVRVLSLAHGGFKQPQQLMTLSWLLSVGERFDLIVNLDGYNEVAFGLENFRRGVYPSYPRNWSLRIGGRDTLEDLEALGRVAYWTERRRRSAAAFDRPLAARTVTGNLVWRLLDRAAADRIQQAQAEVTESTRADLGYAEAGPPYSGENQLYRTVAAHWRRSSILLDRLCRGGGIRYVHLLQPNQYVAGSKPMGAEERAIAIDPKQKRRQAVEKGYPALLAEADALRAAGVEFHDLTGLYASLRAPVYEDACCHVNQLGNELIADYLVDALLAAERH